MDHKDILTSLGGPHAVQSELSQRGVEVKPVTVRAWALEGRAIPAKYWVPLVAIAKDKGLSLSFDQLAQSVSAQDAAA
ncbi:MAG: hypothetical protein CMK96_09650 [Pseudomonas sp.]|jgi:hypothetical protein|nr:hypothetical protein [Pseudomonas sp.]|tara:strand:+ start:563 stop:796 length:234 start_codon:yes stop_codon:yes gene_type:complete